VHHAGESMRLRSPVMASLESRARGRPRDRGADEAILRSAARLLTERGFQRMTLAAVAEHAGVSTATVHRRYRSKAELAIGAMTWIRAETNPIITGDVATDLEAMLRQMWEALTEHIGMGLIGTILVEEQEQPELVRLFRDRIARTRVEAVASVLRAGQADGLVRQDADLEIAAELVVGAVIARYLGAGKSPSPDWFRAVAHDVLQAYRA
jgi:AcrR family transcriptional regulator